nr:immunoglobulin heavy chain junction region [Macaca mulatta]MOV51568.1 immunoglobulin heavy chain junction region [Macaca mulatta]MOV51749.1 immunoglobulin heavy chain junction region [Macaca mulatta]
CARHNAVFSNDHYHTDWFDYW